MSVRTLHALELRSVSAGYGSIDVVREVDLAVPYGRVVALLGPNGGGKSTLLKVIAGQLAPSDGEVVVAGRVVNGARPHQLARRGVCLVPEGRGVFANLSVRENVWMFTHAGISRRRAEEIAFARFPQLARRSRQLAGTLSGGEQQMLAMARALATEPTLLLLDELSMGLAPLVVEELYGQVARLVEDGLSIVVVEQFARAVLAIADHVGVVARGRITRFGTPDEIGAILSTAYLE